jgi:hypothetical protein
MWSKLEYVDVWYTAPAGGDDRKSSQRWHRDFNDRHLLKAFLYLVDVDEDTGPFEYVPRSAPGGELERMWPWRPLGENYPPEDEFAESVNGRSVTFTAPKGTIIFCNTSGFHRGGFARLKPRVLATLTWDSPASLKALSERNYVFSAEAGVALTEQKRYALTHTSEDISWSGILGRGGTPHHCELRPNRRQLDLMGPQVEELVFALASPRSPQACVRELEAEDLREERHAQLVVAERWGVRCRIRLEERARKGRAGGEAAVGLASYPRPSRAIGSASTPGAALPFVARSIRPPSSATGVAPSIRPCLRRPTRTAPQ